jgi:hypothetical protein
MDSPRRKGLKTHEEKRIEELRAIIQKKKAKRFLKYLAESRQDIIAFGRK